MIDDLMIRSNDPKSQPKLFKLNFLNNLKTHRDEEIEKVFLMGMIISDVLKQ